MTYPQGIRDCCSERYTLLLLPELSLMGFISGIRILVVAAILFTFFAENSCAQSSQVLDGVVAIVGSHPILRSDVEALAMSLGRTNAPTTDMRQYAASQLITQRIMVEHAQRDTLLTVSEDEVQRVLHERTQMLISQVGSEAAVVEMYGRSIAQIQQDYRQEIRDELLAQALQRQEYFRIRITPQEVREWFQAIPADSLPHIPELVRLAHIVRFPTVNPGARQEAMDRIQSIRDSVDAGIPFEDLARRHTDDPGSQNTGGRYTGMNIRDFVPEFGIMAGSLQPGEVSQVFETQFGYHFMRLNSRQGDVIDVNHILITVDDSQTDPASAISTLQTLRDSIITYNIPLGRLAREYSEDEYSAGRGGNIVVPQSGERDLRLEALSVNWQRTIADLEVGEISQPQPVDLLDGRSAYHILLLQRRTPPHRLSLETDYALVEEFALQDKRRRELENWQLGLIGTVQVVCHVASLCGEYGTN